MNELTTPVSICKAYAYNGRDKFIFNSTNKMIEFMKLLSNGFIDNIKRLSEIEVEQDELVYSVFEKIDYKSICDGIELYLSADSCMYKKGKFHVFYCSKQEHSTVYNIHMSFMPWLEKECKIAHELYLECIRVINSKNVNVLNYIISTDVEEDHVIDHIEDVLYGTTNPDKHEIEEIQSFAVSYYKETIRSFPKRFVKRLLVKPSKTRFKRLLRSLDVNTPFNYHLKIFATEVFKLFNALPIDVFRDESIKEFKNFNSDYLSNFEENYTLKYEDLFFVSWENKNITGSIMANYAEGLSSEYGYCEYVDLHKAKSWEDIEKIKKINKETFYCLTLLPNIFETGSTFCDAVEDYFDNKYIDKWKKQMPFELQQIMKLDAPML